MDTDAAHDDRHRLFGELPDDLSRDEDLSADHYALIYRIVRLFNFIGDLLEKDLLDFELIAASHARPISRLYQRLKPWLIQKRKRDPEFAQAFVCLGLRCLKWDVARNGWEKRAKPYKRAESPSQPASSSG